MPSWDDHPDPEWAVLRPAPKIPAVRRGTHRRRGRAIGMHMSQFFALSDADRQMTYALSKAGRRPS